MDVRILILGNVNRLLKQEARAYHQFRTALYGQSDGLQIGVRGAFLGLGILICDTVLFRILLKAFPGPLVKGLIVNGAKVGDQGQLISSGLGRGSLSGLPALCLALILTLDSRRLCPCRRLCRLCLRRTAACCQGTGHYCCQRHCQYSFFHKIDSSSSLRNE